MWIKRIKTKERRLREYDRAMLRSAFVSLFWAVISDRKQRGRYTLQMLADKLGTNKSGVSRWFSKDAPNWRIDTISDIANALDLDMEVMATDRITGTVFTPAGVVPVHVSTSTQRPTIIESFSSAPRTATEQMTFGLRFNRTTGGEISEPPRLSVVAQ